MTDRLGLFTDRDFNTLSVSLAAPPPAAAPAKLPIKRQRRENAVAGANSYRIATEIAAAGVEGGSKS